MKLVREHINEKFTDDSDPIKDMGIGKRCQIKKWFDSIHISSDSYVIDDECNLTLRGDLNLEGTAITELPDNLTVRGDLYLERTAITKLPKSMKVKGKIYKDF